MRTFKTFKMKQQVQHSSYNLHQLWTSLTVLQTVRKQTVYQTINDSLVVMWKTLIRRDINELGLTRDSRVIPGLTVVSVLSTSNLGLNWVQVNESYTLVDPGLNSD